MGGNFKVLELISKIRNTASKIEFGLVEKRAKVIFAAYDFEL